MGLTIDMTTTDGCDSHTIRKRSNITDWEGSFLSIVGLVSFVTKAFGGQRPVKCGLYMFLLWDDCLGFFAVDHFWFLLSIYTTIFLTLVEKRLLLLLLQLF